MKTIFYSPTLSLPLIKDIWIKIILKMSIAKSHSEDTIDNIGIVIGNSLVPLGLVPPEVLSNAVHHVSIMVHFLLSSTGTAVGLVQSHSLYRML